MSLIAAPAASAGPLADAASLLDAIQYQMLGLEEPVDEEQGGSSDNSTSNNTTEEESSPLDNASLNPSASTSSSSAELDPEAQAEQMSLAARQDAEREAKELLQLVVPQEQYRCYDPYVPGLHGARPLLPFAVCYGTRYDGCDVLISTLWVSCVYGVVD